MSANVFIHYFNYIFVFPYLPAFLIVSLFVSPLASSLVFLISFPIYLLLIYFMLLYLYVPTFFHYARLSLHENDPPFFSRRCLPLQPVCVSDYKTGEDILLRLHPPGIELLPADPLNKQPDQKRKIAAEKTF